jgi:mono/diheme cytochrome c family protein
MALSFAMCASVAWCAEPSALAVEKGKSIAEKVCSACHVVEATQEFPPILDPPAPSFVDIANRPDTDAAKIRHFVSTTHWDTKTLPMKMPNPMLLDSQTADVARYVMSLRRH